MYIYTCIYVCFLSVRSCGKTYPQSGQVQYFPFLMKAFASAVIVAIDLKSVRTGEPLCALLTQALNLLFNITAQVNDLCSTIHLSKPSLSTRCLCAYWNNFIHQLLMVGALSLRHSDNMHPGLLFKPPGVGLVRAHWYFDWTQAFWHSIVFISHCSCCCFFFSAAAFWPPRTAERGFNSNSLALCFV